MGRLGKLKRQAIQEANQRNLLERADIISDDGETYTVYSKGGNIALETDSGITNYKLIKKGSFLNVPLNLDFIKLTDDGELEVVVSAMGTTKTSVIPFRQVREILDNVSDSKDYFEIVGKENTIIFEKGS